MFSTRGEKEQMTPILMNKSGFKQGNLFYKFSQKINLNEKLFSQIGYHIYIASFQKKYFQTLRK
jgi:hypothetical protein